MLNNFEEYYMKLVDYSKEELIDIATKSFYYVHNILKEEFDDKSFVMDLMIDLLDGFLVCDGPVNKEEAELYNNIFETEFSIDEINELVDSHKEKSKERLPKLDKMKMTNTDLRDTLFLMGASVAAIDGEINVKEQEYIEQYSRVDIVKEDNDKSIKA